MPTVKEVDNRPVAVGKWPRQRFHRQPAHYDQTAGSTRQKLGRSGNNDSENCVHKYENICLDVLLRPELLHEIYGDRGLFNSSSNPLLEFCLDGGYLKDFEEEVQEDLSSLLELCSDFCTSNGADLTVQDFEERLEHLCQTGCDINVQSSQGFTALHFLISGCSKESFDTVARVTRTLLRHGLDVSLKDNDGNTSLTFLARLLDKQLHTEGYQLANILLQDKRCNANSVNSQGRSLLSFSVTHGDTCSDLTRKLLNHGAEVLPYRAGSGSDATRVLRERECSAFSWFLRSAMRHQDLSICSVTLKLLCDALAVQPEFMRTHVLSTMLHLGQESGGATSPRMAALFVELKSFMTPYWRQPLPLRYLCVNRIRGALGPKNISNGALQLELPSTFVGHIHLH